jgi:S-methylmethionine-dependent homocysteine/selenocysteine methylase
VTGKPVVAYPNSGERWDPASRRWVGAPALDDLPLTQWVADGARLIGGCCRVMPAHISQMASTFSR